jgi:restriction endonuclease S subunit
MRIKEFCNIRMGHAFRERLVNVPEGDVRVIQPRNISSGGCISFSEGEPLHIDKSVSKPLRNGDVLVVNRGRFVVTVFALAETGTWIAPSSILILSVKKESILPEYVACYFNSPSGQRMFRRHYEQTTVPFISTKNLANMDIPVPPLERQRSLVAFEKVAKEYARLTNRKLELQRQILSHALVTEKQSTKRRTQ